MVSSVELHGDEKKKAGGILDCAKINPRSAKLTSGAINRKSEREGGVGGESPKAYTAHD